MNKKLIKNILEEINLMKKGESVTANQIRLRIYDKKGSYNLDSSKTIGAYLGRRKDLLIKTTADNIGLYTKR